MKGIIIKLLLTKKESRCNSSTMELAAIMGGHIFGPSAIQLFIIRWAHFVWKVGTFFPKLGGPGL
jgi:hypothetical protein